MMHTKLKKDWVQALRSGEYTQGEARLIRLQADGSKEHCCLGVLCEIDGLEPYTQEGDLGYQYLDDNYCTQYDMTHSLSGPYLDSVGMTLITMNDLIHMNDDDAYTFDHIADYIEKTESI